MTLGHYGHRGQRRLGRSIPKRTRRRSANNRRLRAFESETWTSIKYTQQVHIGDSVGFTPEALVPHLQYFQSLDRVHTLTFENHHAIQWAGYYNTHFTHFHPTLTSLTLTRSAGHYRAIMQFALQFPNLESLCLEWLVDDGYNQPGLNAPIVVDEFPPLRGHLRLAVGARIQRLADFSRDLQDRANFRSVEIDAKFLGRYVQRVLNVCAHTIENLTIASPETGAHRSPTGSCGITGLISSDSCIQLVNPSRIHGHEGSSSVDSPYGIPSCNRCRRELSHCITVDSQIAILLRVRARAGGTSVSVLPTESGGLG